MIVVVFGAGVTGRATGTAFELGGANVLYVDPPKGVLDGLEPYSPDAVMFCVPSPARDTSYIVDAMAVADVQFLPEVPFVLRSTVPPGTMAMLEREFPDRALILMPEFLRETTAVEDACKRDRAWIGSNDPAALESFAELLASLGYANIVLVPIPTLEMVKISLNTLLATKVAFANLIYDLAENTGADYALLTSLMTEDHWVHPYGLTVPGRHGRGYAGTCLPKDTDWFIMATEEASVPGAEWLQVMQLENARLLEGNTP